jgi:hypothetical protein
LEAEDRFVMSSGIEKRINELEHQVGSSRVRTIVIEVPTMLVPIKGTIENDGIVTPEIRAAADALLRAVDVSDADFIVEIAHFYTEPKTNGETEPTPVPLPQIISVT